MPSFGAWSRLAVDELPQPLHGHAALRCASSPAETTSNSKQQKNNNMQQQQQRQQQQQQQQHLSGCVSSFFPYNTEHMLETDLLLQALNLFLVLLRQWTDLLLILIAPQHFKLYFLVFHISWHFILSQNRGFNMVWLSWITPRNKFSNEQVSDILTSWVGLVFEASFLHCFLLFCWF